MVRGVSPGEELVQAGQAEASGPSHIEGTGYDDETVGLSVSLQSKRSWAWGC